jgi:hypothetical protein
MIKSEADMYCEDFVELINKLIKNNFIVEEEINEQEKDN